MPFHSVFPCLGQRALSARGRITGDPAGHEKRSRVLPTVVLSRKIEACNLGWNAANLQLFRFRAKMRAGPWASTTPSRPFSSGARRLNLFLALPHITSEI